MIQTATEPSRASPGPASGKGWRQPGPDVAPFRRGPSGAAGGPAAGAIPHPAPEFPNQVIEVRFRTKIFAERLRPKLISPALVARMKSWQHTGFNVDTRRTVAPENRAEGEDVPKEEGGETTEGEEKQEKEEKRERRPKGSRRKRYEGTYEPVLIRDSVNNFFLLCGDRF